MAQISGSGTFLEWPGEEWGGPLRAQVISDLLKPEKTNLHIREDRKRGIYVDGLSEWVVRTPEQVRPSPAFQELLWVSPRRQSSGRWCP